MSRWEIVIDGNDEALGPLLCAPGFSWGVAETGSGPHEVLRAGGSLRVPIADFSVRPNYCYLWLGAAFAALRDAVLADRLDEPWNRVARARGVMVSQTSLALSVDALYGAVRASGALSAPPAEPKRSSEMMRMLDQCAIFESPNLRSQVRRVLGRLWPARDGFVHARYDWVTPVAVPSLDKLAHPLFATDPMEDFEAVMELLHAIQFKAARNSWWRAHAYVNEVLTSVESEESVLGIRMYRAGTAQESA